MADGVSNLPAFLRQRRGRDNAQGLLQTTLYLVPQIGIDEPLHAEVWVRNVDVGFVHPGQAAKLKLAAFPSQKFGLVEGEVLRVGVDAS